MVADYPAAVKKDKHITISTVGIIVLGVPFGGNVSAMLHAMVVDARHGRSLFAKLAGLDSLVLYGGARGRAAAYVLAQGCLPGAYTFLLRNVDPVDSAVVAEVIDDSLRRFWVRLVAGDPSTVEELLERTPDDGCSRSGLTVVRSLVRTLSSPQQLAAAGSVARSPPGWRGRRVALPIALGGDGFTSAAGIAPFAFLASFLAFAPEVMVRVPAVRSLLRPFYGGFVALPPSSSPPTSPLPQRSLPLPPPPLGAVATSDAAWPPLGAAGPSRRRLPLPPLPPPSPSPPPPPPSPPVLPMISRYNELRSFTAQQGFASSVEWDELSADEGLRGTQAVFTKAYHKVEAAEVRRLANVVEHSRAVNVRLEGLQTPKGIGAGAWLLDAGFRSLVSSEFVVALRRRGFVTFPELRCCPSCSGCGAHADAFGDHAETCPALAKYATTVHNYVRDVLYALARSLGLEPGWETPGLVEGTADRPADVLIPKHVTHGLGREPAHAALDACIDVSGVCSLCDSYVRLPVLQPLYERSQLKMRRALPAGLFVAPLVFSSTGVFLESTLRPLLVRFAEVLREEHPADDDDILQEMSERRFMPQLSTAVQRGWVYRYGRMLRNLSGSEDRDHLAPLGGEAVRSSDLRWPSRAIKRALAVMASLTSD